MAQPNRPLSPYAHAASDGHSLTKSLRKVRPIGLLLAVDGRDEPVMISTSMEGCADCIVLINKLDNFGKIEVVVTCKQCGCQSRIYQLPIE